MAQLNTTIKIDASFLEGLTLIDLCVMAVDRMVGEGFEKHVQFISAEDNISFGLKEGGKIPKVTIEWVDASEANTENFEDA